MSANHREALLHLVNSSDEPPASRLARAYRGRIKAPNGLFPNESAEAHARYALETFFLLGATDVLRMLVLDASEHGALIDAMGELYDEGMARIAELAEVQL